MLNVYLIRHGETQWNADGNRYCGRTDIPLTEKGILQAMELNKQLENISFQHIYSSPLQRAVQTARIAGGSNVVITDNRLIEVDFGKWEGKTKEEFIEEDPSIWNNWLNDPSNFKAGEDGESASEVLSRVNDFFEYALNKTPNGNILVVGHNGINRLYLSFKLSMQLKYYRRIHQENASITLFNLNPETRELTLKLLNSRL